MQICNACVISLSYFLKIYIYFLFINIKHICTRLYYYFSVYNSCTKKHLLGSAFISSHKFLNLLLSTTLRSRNLNMAFSKTGIFSQKRNNKPWIYLKIKLDEIQNRKYETLISGGLLPTSEIIDK